MLSKYNFYVYSLKRENSIDKYGIAEVKTYVKRSLTLSEAMELYRDEIKDKNVIFTSLGVSDDIGEIDLIILKDGLLQLSKDIKFTHFNKDKAITLNVISKLKELFL